MKVQSIALQPDGQIPNNPRLPAILYGSALRDEGCEQTARALERLFDSHGWRPRWRDTVYPFQHYHSNTHEVLGIAAGSARLQIGGPHGQELSVRPGDVLLLPAGTGHRCLQASDDFLVVGAYPNDEPFDLCREAPGNEALQRIEAVPLPPSDPVAGTDGPVRQWWAAADERAAS